jgi:hypothetical protein
MPRSTTAPKDTDSRQRQSVVTVRLLPNEDAALSAMAASQKVSRAELLRRALLRDLTDAGCLA